MIATSHGKRSVRRAPRSDSTILVPRAGFALAACRSTRKAAGRSGAKVQPIPPRRAFKTICVNTPAIKPQNAEPIDSSVKPDAVTMNVTSAGSR
jgi:hypothetical protein